MDIHHECNSTQGRGTMTLLHRTDRRVAYHPPIGQHHSPDETVKPKTPTYWQPYSCRHCGMTVYELVGGQR